MTCRGHIKNGAVVLDEPPELPEGSEVTCIFLRVDPQSGGEQAVEAGKSGLHGRLMAFAGSVDGLPPDASVNLHHYLYGHAKR